MDKLDGSPVESLKEELYILWSCTKTPHQRWMIQTVTVVFACKPID